MYVYIYIHIEGGRGVEELKDVEGGTTKESFLVVYN